MSDYQKRILAEAARRGLDNRVGVTRVNVVHADDCPMAGNRGRGRCDCYPELQFLDEHGHILGVPN